VLLARRGEPLPLERVALRAEIARDYRDLVPDLEPDQWRRIRGEQEIIVRHEPERALATLPDLLADPDDRERFIAFIERLFADRRMQAVDPTPEQQAMLARLRTVLDLQEPRRRLAAVKKA
jgi:hypothetical protein